MTDTFRPLKVISRHSPLALKQVEEVFSQFPALEYELVVLESYGDKHKEISLLKNPPPDIFTRELDQAILHGTADIAVHSAKDLPYPLPQGLEVISLFAASDQTDSLITRGNLTLAHLHKGAKVGTSSPVRRRELLALRPDVEVVGVRGTIEERIVQVDNGKLDALIVASCALARLGLSHRAAEVLPFETHPLQGNLAIVARSGQIDLQALFASKDVRSHYGKVTLVGFGPGNLDLLTIGGDKSLSEADIIFHDDLLDKNFLQKYWGEKVYVGKRKGQHSMEQSQINRLLLDAARAGKDVVRLKGGDPMLFAHGGEEIEYLQSHFVKVEVIPGVSSGIAVAALTKTPLTHRDIASSVAFISGHSDALQIPDTDTLVYFMGGSSIRRIAQKAIEKGKDPSTPAMLTYNVSMPDQQEFYSTLRELSQSEHKFPTPIIIVIGEVVSLRNRTAQELARPVMLVTGTDTEQYATTGRVIHQPLFRIEPVEDYAGLNAQLNILDRYDWLFFTSRYAVRFFFDALQRIGKDSRALHYLKVASIGNVTSEALLQQGIVPDLQASGESSEGLLNDIRERKISSAKVLIPRSDIALPVLPEGLKKMGWKVTTMSIYHNVYPEDIQPVDLNKVDIVVFSSPSSVNNFLKLYGSFPKNKEYIFRGKETEKRFKSLQKSPQRDF